jgi:ferredoxin
MKAVVDGGSCTGCGVFADMCPEVFEMGDDNISKVKADPIPAGVEASAKDAASSCPVSCIAIS